MSSSTIAFLLPLRAVGGVSLLVAPLVALAFFGATGAACGAGVGAVRAAFNLASASRMLARSSSSPSVWMAFQIRVQVDLGRLDLFVAESECDHRGIDAGAQQSHGG